MTSLIETSWVWRRTLVYISTVWCLIAMPGLALFGADTAVTRAVVETLGWVAMSCIIGYLGGAGWDDLNRLRHGRIDVPPPLPPDGPER